MYSQNAKKIEEIYYLLSVDQWPIKTYFWDQSSEFKGQQDTAISD